MTRQLFGIVSAALVSGVAVLAMASQAQAFTVINESNAASGGSRVMLADPGRVAALSRDGTTPSAPALGITGGLNRGPGYGGAGVFDFSSGSTAPDNFPTFPGSDNHLTPGVNAGMLTYGAIPGRDNWR